MVQLREEGNDLPQIKRKAIIIQQLLNSFGVPLIINDHVELAAEIGAEGVHLGQGDMSPELARKILGPDKIIGISVESMAEVIFANCSSAIDYVTASAVLPSKTKPYSKKIWGLEGLKEVVTHSKHPVTAIGGIKAYNLAPIMNTGIEGVAVIGAIHDANNPYQAAEIMRGIIERRGICRGRV